jgi:hypothetical protein
MQLVMYHPGSGAVRAVALFVSALQRSDRSGWPAYPGPTGLTG